jgi:NAD(P)-dependent dehydrogenase (short-subunit alcohol dehydrogenase family)
MAQKEITMQDKPVALVTGANQRIGLQIAKDLVAHGFTVLVGSRSLERGEGAAREVGPDSHALQLDVTDQASIAAAAQHVRNQFGRLDVLVNNAAIARAYFAEGAHAARIHSDHAKYLWRRDNGINAGSAWASGTAGNAALMDASGRQRIA